MKRRAVPFRFAIAIIAFYFLVYGLALSPPPAGLRPRLRRPPQGHPGFRADPHPEPEPLPPEPSPGIPYSQIPALPASLQGVLGQLVRPETREWRSIVVHHSGGASGNAAEFDRMHREVNGWEHGLGYHFVVGNGAGSPAGFVEVGGRWIAQLHGAHAGAKATEYNQHGIGICVVGNYEEVEVHETVYSGLRDLVAWLAKRYSISPARILPHSEVRGEPTDCPGKNFPLDRLRDDVGEALK
ncbi:MAG: negative regulator of beta-lactamase [Planctomycetota bacterium]|nr:MAG: negative regulator of beta-lactamase [Planctomycetota bacterium]